VDINLADDVVLKIRVSTNETSGQITWHFMKAQLLSVRYKLALRLQCQDQMALRTEAKKRGKIWSNIWKAVYNPKVCVFALEACLTCSCI
jgi:hypothetical protein